MSCKKLGGLVMKIVKKTDLVSVDYKDLKTKICHESKY